MPVTDKFKDMDFNETKASYENLKGFSNRLKMMPAGTDLKSQPGLNFDKVIEDFNKMKDTSERLKGVKTNHDLPESLVDVDFHEMKEEFSGMAELSKKLGEIPTDMLPDQFKTVNFQDVEADFMQMKTVSEQLANVPKPDKIKELNFADVKTGFDTVKAAKTSFDNFDAGADLT
jgi:hypothetical protein